jgi:hypothetical protein
MIATMARDFRPGLILLATSIALSACSGGGSSTPAPAPSTCPLGAALYPTFQDPMTQPPAGAVGVSTTIGSITVPRLDAVLGATLQINTGTNGAVNGGVFVASGASSLTATVPKLQPNTLYIMSTVGVPCGPYFIFGQFTTGAT